MLETVLMDEMTIYVPQTPEQIAEARELASASELIIAKHSISVSQSPLFNALSALYIMTKRNVVVSMETFNDALVTIGNVEALQSLSARGRASGYTGYAIDKNTGERYILDTPEFAEVIKKNGLFNYERYFSGRLLFSSILPADFSFEKGNVRIVRGILVDGEMTVIKNIVQALVNDYSSDIAAQFINDATSIATIFNETIGLTVGIDDITPEDPNIIYLNELRALAVKSQIEGADLKNREQLIKELKAKNVELPIVKTLDQKIDEWWNKVVSKMDIIDMTNIEKMREEILDLFNDYNNATAKIAEDSMRMTSSLLTMLLSTAKGSRTNAQRAFATGSAHLYRGGLAEFNLNGRRSSFYAPESSRNPAAYGLTRNSYLRGYTPMDFSFQATAGREGMTDTQTGTSEAGTSFQALIKGLENYTVTIYGDIRDNGNNILSHAYPFNPQNMEPVKIENKDVFSFVDLSRVAARSNAKYGYGKNGVALTPIPTDQVRVLKLSKPDITKLIDMSRTTETTLTIRSKDGKLYREHASYFEPIGEIKERIAEKNNIPAENFSLVYKGQALEDKKFLSDYIPVQSNEEVFSIASNQGSVILQTRAQDVPAWFRGREDTEGQVLGDDEDLGTGKGILAPSYVDKNGNVRRMFNVSSVSQRLH